MTANEIREIRESGHEARAHPGKFEGEPIWAEHFYGLWLQGWGEDDYGDESDQQLVTTILVADRDREIFPELHNVDRVVITESDQGFIYTSTEPD